MKRIVTLAVALTLAAGVAACSKKVHHSDVTQNRVVVERLSLDSLDRRLTAVEQRNARVDARARARATVRPAAQ